MSVYVFNPHTSKVDTGVRMSTPPKIINTCR